MGSFFLIQRAISSARVRRIIMVSAEREKLARPKKKKKNDIENNQFWLISLAKNGSVVPTRHSDSYPGMGVVLTRSETC